MALTNKRIAVTEDQVQKWVSRKLGDPKWVAEMKSRSEEAKAQMRARGLLTKSK